MVNSDYLEEQKTPCNPELDVVHSWDQMQHLTLSPLLASFDGRCCYYHHILSSHLVLSRDGHLEVAVHARAYVVQKYNSRLLYDQSCLDMYHSIFRKSNWLEFYHVAKEAI